MRADELVVEVRDNTLTRVGTVVPKDLSIEVFDFYNAVGTWKLTLPEEHPMCEPLRQPGSGIILTLGNYTYSGPTTQPERVVTPTDISGTVTFNGVSDNIVLADYLAWPNPADLTTLVGNGSVTGKAETVMRQLVNENLGSTAITARKKANFAVTGTDLARGTTVTKFREFQQLLQLLQEIANPDGLSFRVVQRGSSLSFEINEIADRSTAVRLSISNGEVASQKIATAAPGATHAIVMGQGWATSKKAIDYTTADSLAAETAWGRRIERFVDEKSSNITADLQRAGLEALTEDGSTQLGIEVVPSEDSSLRFGTDWFLGDKVTVEIDSTETVMQANGVAIKVDEGGARVGMTMGDDAAFTDAAGARTLAGLITRVDNLERTKGDTAWIDPVLLNGFGNYGGGWSTAGYMRRNGIVYLRGLIQHASNRSQTLFNLPAGFRPAMSTHISAIGAGSVSSDIEGINVMADGTVNSRYTGGGWVSLDGISFPADQ